MARTGPGAGVRALARRTVEPEAPATSTKAAAGVRANRERAIKLKGREPLVDRSPIYPKRKTHDAKPKTI